VTWPESKTETMSRPAIACFFLLLAFIGTSGSLFPSPHQVPSFRRSVTASQVANVPNGQSGKPGNFTLPINICDALPEVPSTIDINLNRGWTWVSFNLIGDMDITKFIKGSFSPGDMIKSSTQFTTYYDVHGWFGTLKTLDVKQGYAFKCGEARKLKVTGTPVTLPSMLPISAGWMWIASHHQTEKVFSAQTFQLSGLEVNDMIKSQMGFSQYYTWDGGEGWFGGLDKLEPGVGYKLKTKNASLLVYA